MFRHCILLLLAGAALGCNKACLDLCFPYHHEKLCFEQCGCNGAVRFAPEIVTEDGRRFKVATVPQNTVMNDDGYQYMGCNVNCGETCFRFTSGYNLLNCVVGHCGCNALVSEVFPPPPPQPTYPVYQPVNTPPPTTPQVPQVPYAYQPPAAPAAQPAPQAAPQPAPQPYTYQPTPAPQAAPQPTHQYPYVYQPAPAAPAPQPAAPQPAAPQPAAPQPAAPQPAAPAPQPAAPAPQPAVQPPPVAPAAASPATAPASSITMPFATQDGRHYEIKPLVSDNVFFQSGCAPCVDTCSRLTSYDLVVKCLGFCSCQTQVTEVRTTPGY